MSRIVVDQFQPTIQSRKWPHAWGCHLWHLDNDIAALDAFAFKIGMQLNWRHNAVRFPHYDLTPNVRALAVAAGAREIDRHDPDLRIYLRNRSRSLARDVGALT